MILKHATWLNDRYGVKKGEIISLDFTNKPEFIWLWFGIWALGATPAFINYNLVGERLIHCVVSATSTLVLFDAEIAGVLDDPATRSTLEDSGRRRLVVFDSNMSKVVETWRADRPPDALRNTAKQPDAAILIFTSGTTGMPKPAIMSWRKIHSGGSFCKRWLGTTKDDRFYTSMPLYHSSATVLGLGQILQAKCTFVLGHKFSATRTTAELVTSGATIFQYVGETCRYLLASPPSPHDKAHKVRIAFGNGMRPDVWQAFKSRFNIPTVAEFYAATEGHSGMWNRQTGEFGVGAIGRNGALTTGFLKTRTSIVKVDHITDEPWRHPETGFCEPVPVGDPGELIWRLDPNDIDAEFGGYFNNAKATNAKIFRDVFAKGDAWFRTGDIVRFDKDGLWYFCDRIGDTFRWKSENVSTAEVADVVGTHPDIQEVAVYGIELPAHEGRCGCAAIVLQPGASEEAVLGGLEAHVSSLPRYARPVFVRVCQALEKTGNNKIVKHSYKLAGVQGVSDVWWCPVTGDGYRRFGDKQWKELVGGKHML